jgi:adenylate cyclase
MLWEIDVFEGANSGLVLAEVELADESQQVILPGWVLEEVSYDKRYYNSYLSAYPYKNW